MNKIINKSNEIIKDLKQKFIKNKNSKIDTLQKHIKNMPKLDISNRQKKVLNKLVNSRKTQEDIKKRASIILLFDEKRNKSIVAKELGTYWNKVNKWVNKFISNQEFLNKIEIEQTHKLKKSMLSILSDNYRSGRSSTFTSVQIASIIFVSLQEPQSLGVPISHWSRSSLKAQILKMKIVDKISTKQIGRYLKEMDINVHKYKGWLNSIEKNEDFDSFKAKLKEICDIYENSEKLNENGIIVTCSDEKMSIQALEHKHEKKTVKIGSIEKVEQEYIRQGTTGVIATRVVNTGEIIVADVQPTRTEIDYVEHIKKVISTNKDAERILIMDQLNTHMSEGLVRFIANECNINIELGKKGVRGILKSKESRKAFLEDSTHRIRIVYTPKHTSWMNQIEIWFGILSKQLLNKRSSFKTVEELESKIREYIDYYNENLAKRFKWNSGKILRI